MENATTSSAIPDLSRYGIERAGEIYYNLSWEELYDHETDPSLEGMKEWSKQISGR
jgi:hypothetical protein